MLYQKFKNGINIGGWLSQYELIAKQPPTGENLTQHLKTFITEDDIKQIASWHFDHVRLPVSGFLLYNPDLDCLNKEALSYIYNCITWCTKNKLNLVLDLHDVWGNIYGAMENPMPLLTDVNLQHRFIRIWELLSQELKDTSEITIMFELLNEVSDASGAYPSSDATGATYDLSQKESFLWNRLYSECICAIRSIDPKRWILVGSNGQNSVAYLKELKILDDSLVFYNFHYYDPQVFTHQQAAFSEEMKTFNRPIDYPDDISAFVAFLNTHPDWKQKHALVATECNNDTILMKKLLQHAIDFITNTGKELYCGEFGVISHAPANAAQNWVHNLTEIMEQNQIGHALWNYKYLDFGLLDLDGNPCSSLLQ